MLPARPGRAALLAATLGASSACAPPMLDDAISVEILFPISSQEVAYCPTLPVVVSAQGFDLSEEGIDQDPVEGQGHWHLEVNGEYLGNSGTSTFYLGPELALESGRSHALVAKLRTNDHQPLDPDVSSTEVEIRVEDSATCVGGVGPDPDTGA